MDDRSLRSFSNYRFLSLFFPVVLAATDNHVREHCKAMDKYNLGLSRQVVASYK